MKPDVDRLHCFCAFRASYPKIAAPPILGLVIVLFSSHVGESTIVLTACSGNGIILAADGLSLQPDANPPTAFPSCKIIQGADSCFFAISGMQDKKSIHYDLVPIAKRACRSNGSISSRARLFQKTALPEIERAWSQAKVNDPRSYAIMKAKGGNRVSVAFVGGPPFVVAIAEFIENTSGHMIPQQLKIDLGDAIHQTAFEGFGNDNFETYQRQHPEIGSLDDSAFVRTLLLGAISIENQKPPGTREIGQPVAILAIDDKGPHWIEQGKCAAVNHNAKQARPNQRSRLY